MSAKRTCYLPYATGKTAARSEDNISGHNQISHNEGKEEISKSISNEISAKNTICNKDQSKSDSIVVNSDIDMTCSTLTESSKGAKKLV